MNQTDPADCRQIFHAFMQDNTPPKTLWRQGGVLPIDFLLGLYQTLVESGLITFLDFNDLDFPSSMDIRTESGLRELYQVEYSSWRAATPGAIQDINVFIQHDSDSAPQETQYLCALEAEVGIRSTTSVFARYIESDGSETRYPIDYSFLKRLQDERGMCFTYHCNAAEVAKYDESRIARIFNEDVLFLKSEGLDIHHYSAHGGQPSETGKNNNSFYYPELSTFRLISTHNRFMPSGLRYSDGSFVGRLKKADPALELRRYLIEKLPIHNISKTRHFILIHPQYYFATSDRRAALFFPKNSWLEEYWSLYHKGRALDYWEPLRKALATRS